VRAAAARCHVFVASPPWQTHCTPPPSRCIVAEVLGAPKGTPKKGDPDFGGPRPDSWGQKLEPKRGRFAATFKFKTWAPKEDLCGNGPGPPRGGFWQQGPPNAMIKIGPGPSKSGVSMGVGVPYGSVKVERKTDDSKSRTSKQRRAQLNTQGRGLQSPGGSR
jgi:hypothetical protein